MMLRYLSVVLTIWASCTAAFAQEAKVNIIAPEEPMTIGVQAILRIELLVPTYMPQPPVWPRFSSPTLLVELPERASVPVSRRIDGVDYAGISRGYRITAVDKQSIALTGLKVTVTYADPDTAQSITETLSLPEIRIPVHVPEKARDLDPIIISSDLALEQQVIMPENIAVGEAVKRRVIATFMNTPAMMIPRLIAPLPMVDQDPAAVEGREKQPENDKGLVTLDLGEGLRAYESEPKTETTDNRGVVTTKRTEEVTYLLAEPGIVTLPPIEVKWYNPETEMVETNSLDPVEIAVPDPPPPPLTTGQIAARIAIGAGAVFALFAVWFTLRDKIIAYWKNYQATRRTSETYAFTQLKQSIRHKDLNAAYHWLPIWTARLHGHKGVPTALQTALSQLGASRYSCANSAASWPDFQSVVTAHRQTVLAVLRQQVAKKLPPLNQ